MPNGEDGIQLGLFRVQLAKATLLEVAREAVVMMRGGFITVA
jgi:hypothetical protein